MIDKIYYLLSAENEEPLDFITLSKIYLVYDRIGLYSKSMEVLQKMKKVILPNLSLIKNKNALSTLSRE